MSDPFSCALSCVRLSCRSGVIGLLAAACALAACEPDDRNAEATLPYDNEYPEIRYARSAPQGRLGRLAEAVESGAAELAYDDGRGYLDAVLEALAIDPSSQVLVFSRTSLQTRNISPETPRAIYFNDDSYLAWIPGARTIEIAGYDPDLGPVFYTLLQDRRTEPAMERELGACLRCHDTYSLSGGGVPRFLLGSGYTGTEGELVSHEAWILTSQATPLRSRWGGWYVTGRHGDARHLGNIVVERAEDLQDLEALRVGNVDELGGLFDTSSYLRPTSDIVALMVLEHQIEVQNLISRLRFESAGRPPGESAGSVDRHIEGLVRAMLTVDAIELPAPIQGGSGFSESFQARGPFDLSGRSLRELDLDTRLFRYPMSYLIYSDAFAALPDGARRAVYARIREILTAVPGEDAFTSLTREDRAAVAQILRETLPAVFVD
ncbi:MAG TPA: hypothetical protein VMR74_02235 [Gammaproteobacteria bacterium]|nr:hypothetical protein [Gammaproteobacteria bacterium]